MNALFSRFALRLVLPFAGLAAMVAMAEPLPEPAPASMQLIGEEIRRSAELVRVEAERVRQESIDATEQARASAAAMRWLITLPAPSASGRRCLVDSCSDG